MPARRTLIAVALFLVLAPAARAQSRSTSEVRRQLSEYFAAWRALDVDRAGALYAHDADILYFDGAPLKYSGWAEYARGARAGFASLKAVDIGPSEDMVIHRNGGVAWSTGTFWMTVVPKAGESTKLHVRSTIIWERRGSRWLVAHEHLSVPFQPPPKK
ncbi:MAG: nuclear transport factor 2 family protein [Gemmatimonadota bacterium]|nr:nuclear transport factor 2 family protein [Gemmatimonadota bacterium]